MSELPNMNESILLSCLLNGERYGRELRLDFEGRAQRVMPAGSLYVMMDRLEADGLVASRMGEQTHERGGNRRRYFRLTAKGHRALSRVHAAMAFGTSAQAGD